MTRRPAVSPSRRHWRRASAPPLHASAAWRFAVLWLMTLVLPMQGIAGCVYAVLGPLHVHTRPPVRGAAPVKLVDLRRAAYGGTAVATMGTAGAFGLDGASIAARHRAPQRHRHAFGDASVQVIGADLGTDGAMDDDGHSAAASLAALAAVAPSMTAWQARPLGAVATSHPAWAPSTADLRLPERPPKSTPATA